MNVKYFLMNFGGFLSHIWFQVHLWQGVHSLHAPWPAFGAILDSSMLEILPAQMSEV